MITEKELLEAISVCQQDPVSYSNIEKLANLYTVYDHIFKKPDLGYSLKNEVEHTIGSYGDSEFLKAINGQKSEKVWAVLNELMQTLEVINPRIYNGVLSKLQD